MSYSEIIELFDGELNLTSISRYLHVERDIVCRVKYMIGSIRGFLQRMPERGLSNEWHQDYLIASFGSIVERRLTAEEGCYVIDLMMIYVAEHPKVEYTSFLKACCEIVRKIES